MSDANKKARDAAQRRQKEKHAAKGSAPKPPSQSDTLLRLALSGFLFHAPDGRTFATVPVKTEAVRHETLPIRSTDFRHWLSREHYLEVGKPPGSKAMQDVLALLEARGRFDGPCHEVYLRIGNAGTLGTVFLDLCSPDWQLVEITGQGWRVKDHKEVKFRRTRSMLSLPKPMRGGSIDELRPFVNVGEKDTDSERRWRLIVVWLVMALRPQGPYPVLNLSGEQGSCKSTTARVLRALIDPNAVPLRSEPKEARDLMVAAVNSWVVCLDNISHLSPWLSDAICCLSTGGGFAARELYSDSDESAFGAMRPVILNGIEELATRGDLLDRSLVVHLPTLQEDGYRTEREFWTAFEKARPRILGALLTAVSGALANQDDVELERPPRMADFAAWLTAAEGALGWEKGAFMKTYQGNREEANDLALEGSTLYPHLDRLLKSHPFEGTFAQLKEELDQLAPEIDRKSRQWPKNARSLSGAIRRLAPNLRRAGFEITLPAKGGRDGRLVRLSMPGEKPGEICVPCVPSVPEAAYRSSGNGRNAGNANSGDFFPDDDFTPPRFDN